MERDAKRVVGRIQDHQEIVKQYQNAVRAYHNFMSEYPWMTEGRFGDILKDDKRKSQSKYELGRLMGEYAVPLPLGNLSLNNKETIRLGLWKNHRGMCFVHVEHMEEGQEQNKEWENFCWTVHEDKIEELINEKLNQEFPEEVEIRENQDYDSEEKMTSETEETYDDESETNNSNVNNYLDSTNMVTNLEKAMKIAEE